ncbi:MAG: hypothetical protein AB7P04_01170 [Bacteriovoracia bacterium]
MNDGYLARVWRPLFFIRLGLLTLLLSAGIAGAKPLSDSVSTGITVSAKPGMLEITGQQNLYPRFGLLVGFQRMAYGPDPYAGWEFGGNVLLFRALGEWWQANGVLGAGFAGMSGPDHGHSALWTRLDLDWETRRVLVAWEGYLQRGNRMPNVDASQARLGYAFTAAEMTGVQPWLIAGHYSRSGVEGFPVFGAMRFMTAEWWLEAGASLRGDWIFLGASISL